MAVSPMMQQYLDVKNRSGDAIVLFRLGDFYEAFFDDANLCSRELDLTLTAKNCGNGMRAPMCGVPFHAVQAYIARLVEKGYKVAICEQLTDPKATKGLVERGVTRIITPGTVVDEMILDERQNNYLMSIMLHGKEAGVAFTDVSTGEFCVFQLENALDDLPAELSRIAPREIIANSEAIALEKLLNAPVKLSAYTEDAYDETLAAAALNQHFQPEDVREIDNRANELALCAAGALMSYLVETQKNPLQHISVITQYQRAAYMSLDPFARRNLELTESLRDRKRKGSLLWLLDKTCTSMGSRTLRSWIIQPLLRRAEIEERLDAVEELQSELIIADTIREQLSSVCDLERMMSRISYLTINARDCTALLRAFNALPEILIQLETLNSALMHRISGMLNSMDELAELLGQAIAKEPPMSVREGGMIREGFNATLDKLRAAGRDGKTWIAQLEAKEREETGIKNLKIGYNRVFGYYIEVTKSFYDHVPYRYARKQTLANCERFTTQELKKIEDQVLGAEEKAVALEYQLFCQVRSELSTRMNDIKSTAQGIKLLDCLLALAQAATDYNYVRPALNEEGRLNIVDGRHPVVEQSLSAGASFVPNDTQLDRAQRLMVITGPNMAGKSTYMRQVALITLMAQMGSFVPASSADICLTDRIFTRIGASDDLYGGQSTFMVEMSELSQILRHATSKSLIVLDEIGRGTGTFDGLSIAWAVVEHIADRDKCGALTLFATHYHELSELEGRLEGVIGCCITARETGDDVVFLRKLQKGGADKSYGVAVAGLAGLPKGVLARAREIMAKLEVAEINKTSISSNILSDGAHGQTQLDMVNFAPMELVEELRNVDVMNLSPMDAINQLYLLREKARNIV